MQRKFRACSNCLPRFAQVPLHWLHAHRTYTRLRPLARQTARQRGPSRDGRSRDRPSAVPKVSPRKKYRANLLWPHCPPPYIQQDTTYHHCFRAIRIGGECTLVCIIFHFPFVEIMDLDPILSLSRPVVNEPLISPSFLLLRSSRRRRRSLAPSERQEMEKPDVTRRVQNTTKCIDFNYREGRLRAPRRKSAFLLLFVFLFLPIACSFLAFERARVQRPERNRKSRTSPSILPSVRQTMCCCDQLGRARDSFQ